ncbi:MAG: hypothetical protein KF687_02410 [Cyclobacteriaceae bacterium]|nr:hypothetical protein [Cyclobacteriaceae bacterium]
MRFNTILYLILIAFMAFACTQKQEKGTLYVNIDSLIQQQIGYLIEQRASIRKEAILNGVEQDSVFTPKDSAAWALELDIFKEIGLINRPINRGNYDLADGLPDANSNLKIYRLTARSPLPIRYVEKYYQDVPSKLRKIEALYFQENSLMTSSRTLTMEFTDLYNKNILTTYTIEGGQKLFLGDSVHFIIKGSVLY